MLYLIFLLVMDFNINIVFKWMCYVIAAEVRGNSNDTLLAGSLAKALCCILTLEYVYSNDVL